MSISTGEVSRRGGRLPGPPGPPWTPGLRPGGTGRAGVFHKLTGNGLSGSATGPPGPSQFVILEGTGDHPLCGSREGSGSSPPPPPPGLEGVRGIKGWRESPSPSTADGHYSDRYA